MASISFMVLLISMSLVACSRGPSRPQTTQEFRERVLENQRARFERWVVADSYENVSERLRHAFTSCFQLEITSCVGYGCFSEFYSARALEEGRGRRAIGIMMTTPKVFGHYRHGAFRLLLDVERGTEGETAVSFHGFHHRQHDRFLLAAYRWSHGLVEPLQCPDVQFRRGDTGASEVPPIESLPGWTDQEGS